MTWGDKSLKKLPPKKINGYSKGEIILSPMKFFSQHRTNGDWKEKAKKRREENKKLHKRIQELTLSRDKWKEKHQKLQEKNIETKKNEETRK